MSSELDLHQAVDVAIQTALEAGAVVRRWFGRQVEVHTKSSAVDLVTRVDRESEQVISERIRGVYPGHVLLGEETGWSHQLPDAPTWVVDPIDGTTNFVHGIPFFAVSIGLVVRNCPVVGVVYDPIANELFSAVTGCGAYLNGRRVVCDRQDRLETCVLSTRNPTSPDGQRIINLTNFSRAAMKCRGMRSMGAGALENAHVAAGRLSGFWEFGIKPWDFAAAAVLVTEAGGRVTRVNGSALQVLEPGSVLMTNGLIHDELLALLTEDDQ